MPTRIKFAAVAGSAGLVVGCVAAVALKNPNESFPVYIVVACIVTFAACGAIAKQEWVGEVIAFFVSKIH